MRMLIGRLLLVLVLAAVVGSCTTAQPPVAQKADLTVIGAAVDSINKAFFTAVAARDTDAVASFYSDDARLLPPNAPRADGRAGIRAAWAEFLRTPDLSLDIKSSGLVTSEAGDLVVDIGSYTMKAKGPKGAFEDVGKYVTVLRKADGGWKIVVDTFNSDTPLPAQ